VLGELEERTKKKLVGTQDKRVQFSNILLGWGVRGKGDQQESTTHASFLTAVKAMGGERGGKIQRKVNDIVEINLDNGQVLGRGSQTRKKY